MEDPTPRSAKDEAALPLDAEPPTPATAGEAVPTKTANDAVLSKPAPSSTPSPSTPGPVDDGFALHGAPFTLVMIAMCIAVFMAGLDGTIVVVAMPQIALDFDALSTISWVFLAYLLTQTAGTPLWGRAADMMGRKLAMLAALCFFVVGSIACALSTTFAMLAIFRAVQGIGGGGLMSVAMVLLADMVPAEQRGAYLAPLNSMFALSSVVGPIVGGYLTGGPGWRFCFWINVPVGAVCAIILYLYVPHTIGRGHMIVVRPAATAADVEGATSPSDVDPVGTKPVPAASTASSVAQEEPELDVGTIDWAGIVLVVGSVTCLCLGVTWGGSTYSWDGATIIALLVVAAITAAAFVYVEGWVALDPVVPMRLFKVWNFSVCIIIGAATGWAMFGQYVYLPIFFESAKGESASAAGASMIPMMLAMPVGAMMSGIGLTVFKWLDYKVYPLFGCILTAVACGLYTTMTPSTPNYALVGNLILGGLVSGLSIMVPMLVAQNSVSKKDIAVATSTLQFVQSIAGLVVIAVMQSYFNGQVESLVKPLYSNGSSPDAISAAEAKAVTSCFYISMAGAIAGAIASAFMRWIPLGSLDEDGNTKAVVVTAPAVASEKEVAAVDVGLKLRVVE